MKKAPSSDLQPVEYVLTLLARAVDDLDTARGTVGNVTDPQELWAILRELRGQVQQAWSQLESEVERLAHVAIEDAGGVIVDEESNKPIKAGWSGGSYEWDSLGVVSRLAAVSADLAIDRETGEVLPQAVFAERVVNQAARCLGAIKQDGDGATSASWRIEALKDAGIKDADKYRTRKGGRVKVEEVSDYKRNRKPVEEAA